jgi:lysophospholipase L1-like esterase
MSISKISWNSRRRGLLVLGLLFTVWVQSVRAQPMRPAAAAAPPTNSFELRDGDRVVLLGDAFMARENDLGYLETRLTLQYPTCDVTFRNLGWLTNTPLGGPRADFPPPEKSFDLLKEQLRPLKPTVAIIGYGMDASAEGEAGLSRFTTNYSRLLDAVQAAAGTNSVRFLLFGPGRVEKLPPPAPDPAARNELLERYTAAIKEVADKRGAAFVSLLNVMGDLAIFRVTNALTLDGSQLSPQGYRLMADLLPSRLRWDANVWRVGILKDGTFRQGAYGIQATNLERTSNFVRFNAVLEQLPSPPVLVSNQPLPGLGPSGTIQVQGLAPTNYALKIGGQWVKTLPSLKWGFSDRIDTGPDFDQAEELRRAIVKKNDLFRQRALVRDSAEAAKVDPLIADQEKTIARLRKPVKRTYELTPAALPPAAPGGTPSK